MGAWCLSGTAPPFFHCSNRPLLVEPSILTDMILSRQIFATARQGRFLLVLVLCQVLGTSCATKPPEAEAGAGAIQTSLHYTAVSSVKLSSIPTKVYLFPPLRCDAKGKPKESLTPIEDPKRGIVDWVSPSAKSKRVRRKLEGYFRSRGNQVVSFQDVLAADSPHSILIISSFYSAPLSVDPPKPGQADKYVLSMVKASTFGVDLDPAKSRSLASIDGVTFYDSARKPADIEGRSLQSGISWLGSNVKGVTSLDP